jgi:hypothetical protein
LGERLGYNGAKVSIERSRLNTPLSLWTHPVSPTSHINSTDRTANRINDRNCIHTVLCRIYQGPWKQIRYM